MNKILIDEETLKQVLETLLWANEEIKEWKDEAHGYSPVDEPVIMEAIAALHKTRAEQPAQRKPLTYEEIGAIDDEIMKSPRGYCVKFTRAIEAAHNIKENT